MNIDLLQIIADINKEKTEANKFPVYALYEEISNRVGAAVALELGNLVAEGKLIRNETLNSLAFTLKT